MILSSLQKRVKNLPIIRSPYGLVLIFAIVGVLLFQALPGLRPLDDSYITYRYVRNILSGSGFVYNPGEAVLGTTTPLFTLLLALLALPFGSNHIPTVSFVVSLAADVFNAVLLFRIARHILKQDLAAFLLVVVFLLHPFRINVAQGGMETSLYVMLLLLMYDKYLISRNILLAGVFGALAFLTRMDAVLAIAPVFLHGFWKEPKQTFRAGLVAAAVTAPWLVWSTWYFGSPIPHSIIAKSISYQYSFAGTLFFLFTFLGTGTIGPYREIFIIFPGLMASLFLFILSIQWIRAGNGSVLILLAFPLLYYVVMAALHAPVFFSWYYIPLMPALLLVFFGTIIHTFRLSTKEKSWQQRAIAFGIFGIILIGFSSVLMVMRPGWADSREVEALFHQSSAVIREDVRPGQTVFAPDIGVIGWELESSRILDSIGLVSPSALKYYTEGEPTDAVFTRMILTEKPDYIISRDIFLQGITTNPLFLEQYQLIYQIDAANETMGYVAVYKRNESGQN